MKQSVTYQDLDAVLAEFGFTRHINNGHIWYEEKGTDTRIPLPTMSADDPILSRHYLATRIILDNMGIKPSAEFDKAMAQYGELPNGI